MKIRIWGLMFVATLYFETLNGDIFVRRSTS